MKLLLEMSKPPYMQVCFNLLRVDICSSLENAIDASTHQKLKVNSFTS